MKPDPTKASERFYNLVWPHRAQVLRMALILSGNQADAEDLAQETLLKSFNAIETFNYGSDARAWVIRILRNTWIDRLRSNTARQGELSLDATEIDVPAEDDPGTEQLEARQDPEQILEAFSDVQIIEALQQLPDEIRMTLLLVDVQQMDHKQAAEILEVPAGTIKSRAHRGRAMLRGALLPLARDLRLVKQ